MLDSFDTPISVIVTVTVLGCLALGVRLIIARRVPEENLVNKMLEGPNMDFRARPNEAGDLSTGAWDDVYGDYRTNSKKAFEPSDR